MSSCCSTPSPTNGTNKFFSRWSKLYAKRFRRKGLAKEQTFLLEGVRQGSVLNKTLLDIGCGVGALHLTLLQEGAARAVGVDLAEGMIENARQFAHEKGLAEKTRYIVGDFVQVSDTVPEADITLLDKVVCCYENLPGLLETSTSRTRSIYALTHPKGNLLIQLMFKAHVAFSTLIRMPFRPFWHDWATMRARITERGFRLIYENSTFFWQVLVYQRV
jgi:magnesium-protoporphyrin O-methyltransferase